MSGPVVIPNPYTVAHLPPGIATSGDGGWGIPVVQQPMPMQQQPMPVQQQPQQAIPAKQLSGVDCAAACLLILATIALTIAFIAWGYLGWLKGQVDILQSQVDALKAKLPQVQGGSNAGLLFDPSSPGGSGITAL